MLGGWGVGGGIKVGFTLHIAPQISWKYPIFGHSVDICTLFFKESTRELLLGSRLLEQVDYMIVVDTVY